jgi:tetratricopeptide (TPR) repeat protein
MNRSDGDRFKGDSRALVDGLTPGLAELRRLETERPNNLRVLRKKLALLRQRGEGLEWVNPPEALTSYEEAVAVARGLFQVDATNYGSRRALASAWSHLGGLYLDAGRYPQAVAALEEARRHQQWLRDQDHTNDADAANLATSRMWLAQSLMRLAHYDSAVAEGLGAVALRDSMLKEQKPDPTSQANLASAHVTLGAVYAGQAADRHTPHPASLAAWRASRAAFQKGLDVFAQLEAAGTFRDFWAPPRARARSGVAQADSALR